MSLPSWTGAEDIRLSAPQVCRHGQLDDENCRACRANPRPARCQECGFILTTETDCPECGAPLGRYRPVLDARGFYA